MKHEVIFGLHAVTTLIKKQPQRVARIWVQAGRDDKRVHILYDLANEQGIAIETVPRKALDQQVNGRHQGVIAFTDSAQTLNEVALDALLEKLQVPAFLLVLDGITDPHNLGACLRSADAAGVHAVIAPKDRSAPLNAVASKVACGAAESVPYIQVTNLARTLKYLQEQGIWIFGTSGEASHNLYQTDLTGPMALVMGAEGEGMRRLTREHCDHLIKIDMAGEVSSLNVSVAAGVCLFEAVRQRQFPLKH
jgi:23S rRNA (guanosine2251-2'-O)-methyltransferase